MMRVPVVATRTGGVPDVVEEGSCGLLVEPRNPQALAESMIRLLSDSALQRRFAEEGQVRMQLYFTAEKMIEGTIKVYERMIERKD